MGNAIIAFVEGAMASPWVYAALFALAAIDGFLPVVPSETLIVTAGVYAANGVTSLPAVVGVAALGAFAGDHASYAIGRAAGGRLRRRREGRSAAALTWAAGQLRERGGSILIVCRYIPGARTATTLTAGTVRHPLRSFSPFVAAAGLSWGVYTATIGYVGGSAFEDSPLLGVVLGLAIALSGLARVAVVTGLVMLIGGLGTWVFAPENTVHIGASGVVFGYASYLVSRGVFDRSLLELAMGALVVAVWGGALLASLVPHEGISWQGHLFGAIGGVVAARLLAPPRERVTSSPARV
jgi:membrane protein DedA with SNARE-associated domain